MDLNFLLHTVLPVAAFAAGVASSVAHFFLMVRHKQDHSFFIDQLAAALGTAAAKANPTPGQSPTAASTP